MKPSILLLHHTEYHFETLLSFWDDLRHEYDVRIWSNWLHIWGREALLKSLGVDYQSTREPGAIIIITSDAPIDPKSLPEVISSRIQDIPTVRVSHRVHSHRSPGELFLFPRSEACFLMHKWGEPPEASAQINAGITRCLVQGNIEPRRDYANLIRLAESSPTVRFNIVGKRTKFHATYPSNVRFFFNLNETEYRRACRNNDFVLPMIDPEQHPSYFLNRFSTSVLCGLACSLPFIAHKELFSIYPIHGLSYESFDGLVEQVAVAEKMQESDRKALQADIATSENEIFRQNLGIFERALGEVMANS